MFDFLWGNKDVIKTACEQLADQVGDYIPAQVGNISTNATAVAKQACEFAKDHGVELYNPYHAAGTALAAITAASTLVWGLKQLCSRRPAKKAGALAQLIDMDNQESQVVNLQFGVSDSCNNNNGNNNNNVNANFQLKKANAEMPQIIQLDAQKICFAYLGASDVRKPLMKKFLNTGTSAETAETVRKLLNMPENWMLDRSNFEQVRKVNAQLSLLKIEPIPHLNVVATLKNEAKKNK